MFSRKATSRAAIAGGCAMFLAATLALAAHSTSFAAGATLSMQRGSEGCGYAAYRSAEGSCQPILGNDKYCQPGFSAWPYMSGYRCVQDGY
jgi:hypothetical protein